MKEHSCKKILRMLTVMSVLGVAACSVEMPTNVTQHRVQVHRDAFALELPSRQLTQDHLEAVVEDYRLNGEGGVDVVIGYDPEAGEQLSAKARDELARVVGAFSAYRIEPLEGAVLPVKDMGHDVTVLISYGRAFANAPKGCEMMPGSDGATVSSLPDYKMGCSVEILMAKQAARPGDLAGRTPDMGLNDGMRLGNKLSGYKQGLRPERLYGETTQ